MTYIKTWENKEFKVILDSITNGETSHYYVTVYDKRFTASGFLCFYRKYKTVKGALKQFQIQKNKYIEDN